MVSGLARNILVVSSLVVSGLLVVWLETYWWYHG